MLDEPNILVGKIVATPSSTSWAQAYNAGKLFAVISLFDESEEKEKDFLNILGKDTIEALEQEYYSLENKDLASVKAAFENAIKKIPENVEFSFTAASIVKNVIYVFFNGEVRVSIKRGESFAELIDSDEGVATQAISGEIKDKDIFIIQTKEFKNLVPTSALGTYVKSEIPDDIAEAIAPIVHKDENGGVAAIIIKCEFAKVQSALAQEVDEKEESEESQVQVANPEPLPLKPQEKKQGSGLLSSILNLIKIPTFSGIPHTKKLILTVVIVIAIILGATIFMAINKQNEDKMNALFESVYVKADEKYKEGESLVDLNKTLASESFKEASRILNDGKDKFPKGSEKEKKILELLNKVDEKMEENSPEQIVKREDRERISLTIENGSGVEGAAGKVADFLKEKGYNVSKTQNADNYKYEGATIKVKDSLKVYADLLEKDLSEEYEVTETQEDLSEDFSTDAVIIIGK